MNKGLLPPEKVRFFSGYSGWGPGQLTWEVEVGSWWVAAASSTLVQECLSGQLSSCNILVLPYLPAKCSAHARAPCDVPCDIEFSRQFVSTWQPSGCYRESHLVRARLAGWTHRSSVSAMIFLALSRALQPFASASCICVLKLHRGDHCAATADTSASRLHPPWMTTIVKP